MRDPQSIGGSARARIRSSDVCIAMSGGTERSTRACALTSRSVGRLESEPCERRITDA